MRCEVRGVRWVAKEVSWWLTVVVDTPGIQVAAVTRLKVPTGALLQFSLFMYKHPVVYFLGFLDLQCKERVSHSHTSPLQKLGKKRAWFAGMEALSIACPRRCLPLTSLKYPKQMNE